MSSNQDTLTDREAAQGFSEALEEQRGGSEPEPTDQTEPADPTDEARGAVGRLAGAVGDAARGAAETAGRVVEPVADAAETVADGLSGNREDTETGGGSGGTDRTASGSESAAEGPRAGAGAVAEAGGDALDVAGEQAENALSVAASNADAGARTDAEAQTRTGQRGAARAVESDPTREPALTGAQARQVRGILGAAEAARRTPRARSRQGQRGQTGDSRGGEFDFVERGARGLVEDATGVDLPTDAELAAGIAEEIEGATGADAPGDEAARGTSSGRLGDAFGVDAPTQRDVRDAARRRVVEATGVGVPTQRRLSRQTREQTADAASVDLPSEGELSSGTRRQADRLDPEALATLAPVAAAEPTPAGEAVLGLATGLGAVAAAAGTRGQGELPARDRSRLPELPVGEGRPRSELPVGDGGGLPTDLPVGDGEATAPSRVEIGDVVPDAELDVPDTGGLPSAFRAGRLTGRQRQRGEREDPTPTVDPEDIPTDLGEPDQPGPSIRERRERDDLFLPEREFPTGEETVIGREVVDEDPEPTTEARDRLDEASEPFDTSGTAPPGYRAVPPATETREDQATTLLPRLTPDADQRPRPGTGLDGDLLADPRGRGRLRTGVGARVGTLPDTAVSPTLDLTLRGETRLERTGVTATTAEEFTEPPGFPSSEETRTERGFGDPAAPSATSRPTLELPERGDDEDLLPDPDERDELFSSGFVSGEELFDLELRPGRDGEN